MGGFERSKEKVVRKEVPSEIHEVVHNIHRPSKYSGQVNLLFTYSLKTGVDTGYQPNKGYSANVLTYKLISLTVIDYNDKRLIQINSCILWF